MSVSAISEFGTFAGAAIVASIFAAKMYDAFKSKDVRNAIMDVLRSKGALNATKNYIKALDVMMGAVIPGNIFYKKLIIILNSSLVLSISLMAEQATTASNQTKKSNTIVGIMLGEKLKKSSKAQLLLVTALLANIIFTYFLSLPYNGIVFLLVGIGLLAIHADHKLIEYRIRNGWYGKNEFESREIIEFILSHANKDDFNDSGGLKKIIPTPELSKEEENITIATGTTA